MLGELLQTWRVPGQAAEPGSRGNELLDHRLQLLEHVAALGLDPEDLVELAHCDHDGQTDHEAGQHRRRHEVRDPPHLRDAEGDEEDAGEDRQPHGERQVEVAVLARQRRDHRCRVR